MLQFAEDPTMNAFPKPTDSRTESFLGLALTPRILARDQSNYHAARVSVIEGLRRGLEFEKLLSEISETFINLSPALVDGAIEDCLRRVVECFHVDRATLWEVDSDMSGLIASHSWHRSEFPHRPERIVKDEFPWLLERIRNGEVICIPRLGVLPEEAGRELDFVRSTGMNSIVVAPLLIGGRLAGALSMCGYQQHQTWDAVVISRFQQAGNVFANALARKHADEVLQAAYAKILRVE